MNKLDVSKIKVSTNDKPDTATRTALAAKLRSLGFKAADLAPFVKAGASRQEIRDGLIAKLRNAPKKK